MTSIRLRLIQQIMDKDTYDSYSEEEAVTDDQVNTKKIELGAITLKEKSVPYSVTANVETSDNSATR